MKSNISRVKHSLGDLRRATNKSKPRSPDLIGNLHLQRNTFEAIARKFHTSGFDEIVCPIAAWGYSDEGGLCLTVQLSPPYQATKKPKADILAAIFSDGEKNE